MQDVSVKGVDERGRLSVEIDTETCQKLFPFGGPENDSPQTPLADRSTAERGHPVVDFAGVWRAQKDGLVFADDVEAGR